MSTLRDSGGGETPLLTATEAAAELGMSWAGLSKWLAPRPRYQPAWTLEMGHTTIQLWAPHTIRLIARERAER